MQQPQKQPPPQEHKSKTTQMRERRKDLYKIERDPFLSSLNSQTVPQYINIHKFLESRAYELKHFNRILQNKFTSKLEHQLLPKHLRRRAMAHNYYRIPLRIRFKSLLEIQPSEPEVLLRSRCRKHRRKIRYLLNQYERRQRKNKWIESHIWHAKRFVMADKWGFKIAYKCNDKSSRAIYKLCQRDSSVICDQSYYRTLIISQNSFDTAINHFKLQKDASRVQKRFLKDEENDQNLMCPVDFIVLGGQKQIIMIVHPIAHFKVIEYLSKLQINVKETFFNNFLLFSQHCAINHFYNVFEPLQADSNSQETFNLLKQLEFNQNVINEGQILLLNIRRDSLDQNFRMNERIFKYDLSSTKEQSQEEYKNNELFSDHRAKNNNNNNKKLNVRENNTKADGGAAGGEKKPQISVVHKLKKEAPGIDTLAQQNYYFKQFQQQLGPNAKLKQVQKAMQQQVLSIEGKKLKPIKWIGTQRGQFTHRKDNQRNKIKVLLTKLKKAKEQHIQLKLEQVAITEAKAQVTQKQDTVMQEEEVKAEESDFITVIIFKNSDQTSTGFGGSFNILIPEGYGLNIFRRLVYSGCKAIGHKEFLSIKLELGSPVFPDDYLHTTLGFDDQYKLALQKAETYCKMPPSKRTNYQKINNPHPFIPSLLRDKEYKFAFVLSVQRGVPKDGAMIYAPSNEDIEALISIGDNKWELLEDPVKSVIDNKQFNFEFSLQFGKEINLTKKEISQLQRIKEGKETYESKFLKEDFSLGIKTSSEQKRQEIGIVNRGGFSQIRGRGVGISLIRNDSLLIIKNSQEKKFKQAKVDKKLKDKVILLIRNVDSLRYIPVYCKPY